MTGSTHDYHELSQSLTRWEDRETGFDASPTPDSCALADAAFLLLKAKAEACGMAFDEPSPVAWVRRRLETYQAAVAVRAAL